jgi:hypothetical protein
MVDARLIRNFSSLRLICIILKFDENRRLSVILRAGFGVLLVSFLWGCGVTPVGVNRFGPPLEPWDYPIPDQTRFKSKPDKRMAGDKKRAPNLAWRNRAVTEKELNALARKDPELTLSNAVEILSRLNTRARYHIRDDLKTGRILKVPINFASYKNWTPLPGYLPVGAKLSKFILIAKDIPFLGWYEYGRLKGDTPICIGKQWGWTRAGKYTVKDKDANHFSQTYLNDYGMPTPMPWALRIYGRVWIHAGDVVGGYASHGCINLPLLPAKKVFQWADLGTVVVVVDSLNDVEDTFKTSAG